MTSLPSVSVVIPTLNEAENVTSLVDRIDKALVEKATYEIIFIDDHSTDKTLELIKSIASDESECQRQITIHTKNGAPGKAYSLIEGFDRAKLDLICMIDADLQYPPEAIPKMLDRIEMGTDVVVGDRVSSETSIFRRQLSRVGRQMYGKWLHDLDCDVQSGLKLFRKSILSDIELNTTAWTFDLSFLVQSQQNGYQISSVPIPFFKRELGDSKVNVLRVGTEILTEAVKFKFRKQEQARNRPVVTSSDSEDKELTIV